MSLMRCDCENRRRIGEDVIKQSRLQRHQSRPMRFPFSIGAWSLCNRGHDCFEHNLVGAFSWILSSPKGRPTFSPPPRLLSHPPDGAEHTACVADWWINCWRWQNWMWDYSSVTVQSWNKKRQRKRQCLQAKAQPTLPTLYHVPNSYIPNTVVKRR